MKKIIVLFITVILILQASFIVAQTDKIDSLATLLQKHTKEDTIRVNLLNEIAYKIYLTDFNKTRIYAEEANKLANKLNYKKGEAKSFRYIGISYYMQANYSLALKYYQKSLNIYEKLDIDKGIARCCNNIGMIYIYQEKFEKALDYLQKARKIGEEIGDKIGLSLSLNNIGNTYLKQGNYSLSLEYYQKSLKIKEELNNKRGIAGSYHNIGKNYKFQENYPKAEEYLQKSLKISIEQEIRSIEARNYTVLAEVYLRQNRTKKAYNYSKKAYILSTEIGESNFQKESSKILALSCEALGSYKEAYKYHVIYTKMNDSIYNEKNLKKIANLEYQYKYEKEKRIDELEQQKQDEIRAEAERRQKKIRNFFISGFIFMILLAALISIILRNKHKANYILSKQKTLIEHKNEELFQRNEEIHSQSEELIIKNKKLKELNATKDKFFSIIAHDLKNPFNTLLGFSELLLKNFKDYDQKQQFKFLNIINLSAKKNFNLLEKLLSWARSQTGSIDFLPEKINLITLLNEIISLKTETAESKDIILSTNIETDLCINADKNMLSTILRNLISNAIKFTPQNGEISINAKAVNNSQYIQISVKDNGVGISEERQSKLFNTSESITTKDTENKTGTGLGLILCKEFTEKHGGKIWVESKKGKGSEFIFTIPGKIIDC